MTFQHFKAGAQVSSQAAAVAAGGLRAGLAVHQSGEQARQAQTQTVQTQQQTKVQAVAGQQAQQAQQGQGRQVLC
jgi:hypothetical protein